jgi:hypothetical protein
MIPADASIQNDTDALEGRWTSWVAGPLARSVCPIASNPVGDSANCDGRLFLFTLACAGRLNTVFLLP